MLVILKFSLSNNTCMNHLKENKTFRITSHRIHAVPVRKCNAIPLLGTLVQPATNNDSYLRLDFIYLKTRTIK